MLTLDAAFRLVVSGSRQDLRAALAGAGPFDVPARLLLEGQIARAEGDVDRCVALMRQAYEHASLTERVYVADCLAPIYVMRSELDALERLLDDTPNWEALPGARPAFMALLSAARNDDKASRHYRDAAMAELTDARVVDVSYWILQRLALAAYGSWDVDEALALAMRSGRLAEDDANFRLAAASYSVAANIHETVTGETELAYDLATRVANASRSAGDESFEIGAVANQYWCSVLLCDETAMQRHRDELRARPMPEQYHLRYGVTLPEVLTHGWSGDFTAMLAAADTLADVAGSERGERAYAAALATLASAALGDRVAARRSSRTALGIASTPKGELIPPHDRRYLVLAQLFAAVACILAGDETRGRRLLAGSKLASQVTAEGYAAILAGGTWEDAPRRSRGYARLLAAVRDAATSRTQAPLTAAEVEVLQILADGNTAAEIAQETGRSINTIRAHRNAILTKLGATTTLQAINAARGASLIV